MRNIRWRECVLRAILGLACVLAVPSYAAAYSMFQGLAANFDLNASSIARSGSTVTAWNDALGGTVSFTPSGTVTVGTLGSTNTTAVTLAGTSGTRLTGNQSGYFKSVFIVGHLDTAGTGARGLFGAEGQDYGIRTSLATTPNYLRGSGDIGDFSYNQSDIYINGSNASTQPAAQDSTYLTKIAVVGNNTLVSAFRGTDGKIADSGAFTPAIGHYATSFAERFYDGDIAEVLSFEWKLDATERNIVNTMLANKYGLSVDGTYAVNSNYANETFFVGFTHDAGGDGCFNRAFNSNTDIRVEFSRLSGSDSIFDQGQTSALLVSLANNATPGNLTPATGIWHFNVLDSLDYNDRADTVVDITMDASPKASFLKYSADGANWSTVYSAGVCDTYRLKASDFAAGYYKEEEIVEHYTWNGTGASNWDATGNWLWTDGTALWCNPHRNYGKGAQSVLSRVGGLKCPCRF